jgi:hypothetical protein
MEDSMRTSPASCFAVAVTLTLAAQLSGCKDRGGATAAPEPSASSASSAASVTSAAPAANAPNALTTVVGTVLESIDAATYTYLRLTTPAGEKWAAVNQSKVAVGDKVTITNVSVQVNFTSPTLKRTFEEIYFGNLGSPGAADPALAAPHGSVDASAAPPKVVAVPKAAGPEGRTIPEIYANKATLKDKKVAVRGTVVKYSEAVMGTNWLHLQDGSTGKAPGDTDITVTTKSTAKVGDVVVARGVVHTDKDLGSGYNYPVIIEDATLEK